MSDFVEPSWEVFGKCPKPGCRAELRQPCVDARRSAWRRPRVLRNPHRGRPKLPRKA